MNPKILKNIGANWLGLITTLVIGFFIFPFMLHRLGTESFGLWVLLSSFTGYYGLLDLGLRNAVIRFVARALAKKDFRELNKNVSTCFFTYVFIGVLVLIATGTLVFYLDSVLKLSPATLPSARRLLLVFGIGTALVFPLTLFGGILEGMQQFPKLSGVQVIAAIVRGAFVIVALETGYGVVSCGLATVVVNFLSYLVYARMVFRQAPELKLRWGYANGATLKTMASFGLITFWIGIAHQLRFQTDALVIGSCISVQAISFFAIGSKLVWYATEGVQNLAQVFTPICSHYDATGEREQLQRLLITGNKYASMVMFPLGAVLIILGKLIISNWVGPNYLPGYPVLVILTASMSLYVAQATSTKVLYGMAKHVTLAWVLSVEGVANLVLSIALAKHMGINGVALGTAIPLTATSLFFLPRHLCKRLDLKLRDYVLKTHVAPLFLVLPLVAYLWLAKSWTFAHSLKGLMVILLLGGILYGLELAVYFWSSRRSLRVRSALKNTAQVRFDVVELDLIEKE